MCGIRLEAHVHIVTGSISLIQNLVKCVEQTGIAVDHVTLQPIASSESVLTAEEKELTQVAQLGSDIRLVCPMSGNPSPIITWKKDGETINSVTWDRFRPNKKSLKVRQVDKEDTGIYICRGTNGFGSNEIRINLIVIGESNNSILFSFLCPLFFAQISKSFKFCYLLQIQLNTRI